MKDRDFETCFFAMETKNNFVMTLGGEGATSSTYSPCLRPWLLECASD